MHMRWTRDNRVIAIVTAALLIASATLIWVAYAAEVTIDSTIQPLSSYHHSPGSRLVFTSSDVGYAFYSDASTGVFSYSKTTDGGATWGTPVNLATSTYSISVWYDRWTPGDTGDIIHIGFMTSADLYYRTLDTANSDTLGVTTNASNAAQGGFYIPSASSFSITKATDGAIYMGAFDESDSYVIKCSSTCDGGVGSQGNWSEVGSVSDWDLDDDAILLMPLTGGNILAIQADKGLSTSYTQLRSKEWNGSSWSSPWDVIDGSPVTRVNNAQTNFLGTTVNPDNGDIYLTYAADNDPLGGADDDIRTAIYSSGSWTSKTDVVTNVNPEGTKAARLVYDAQSDEIYAVYSLRDDAGGGVGDSIYYKVSSDNMTSWGPQQGPLDTEAVSNVSWGYMWVDPGPTTNRIYSIFADVGSPDALYGASIKEIVGCIEGGPIETCADFAANPGALTIVSVPSTENFGSTTVALTEQTIGPYTFGTNIEYADLRDAAPLGNTFSVYASATEFSSGSNSFPYSGNFRIRAQTPTVIGSTNCTTNTSVTSTLTNFPGTSGQQISDPVLLINHGASSASGTSIRQCLFKPIVEVDIPAAQSTGVYTVSLYWTVT